MHLIYNSPHGVLIIIAFVFAVFGAIPWRSPGGLGAYPWFAISWAFFVAAFAFG